MPRSTEGMSQRNPQMTRDGTEIAPGCTQMAQDKEKMALDGPDMAQDGPKMAQDEPRWPKIGLDGPGKDLRWAEDGSKIGLEKPSDIQIEKRSAWTLNFTPLGPVWGSPWRPIWTS